MPPYAATPMPKLAFRAASIESSRSVKATSKEVTREPPVCPSPMVIPATPDANASLAPTSLGKATPRLPEKAPLSAEPISAPAFAQIVASALPSLPAPTSRHPGPLPAPDRPARGRTEPR